MAKKLDLIVVVDLEATCWEDKPPPGEENEIIEIGICTLDLTTGRRLDKESILVKPERSKVSEFCTRLTTLTQEQVDRGVGFKQACAHIRNKFSTRDRPWASYGDYDRLQVERQCRDRGVSYPFGPSHVNVKTLYALAHGLPHEIGMADALKALTFELEGTHHRGADDAWNTAKILWALLSRMRPPSPKPSEEGPLAP